MTHFVHNLKEKMTHHPSTDKGKEPEFSIQPHPAKSNDPADLQPKEGLRNMGPMEAFHAKGPYVPSDEIKKNMPAPMNHDQLLMREMELNRK